MKPLTITTHGIRLTLTTDAVGHSFLCHVKQRQLYEILGEALRQITVLGEADPRGYRE